jgi:hypothetical protein
VLGRYLSLALSLTSPPFDLRSDSNGVSPTPFDGGKLGDLGSCSHCGNNAPRRVCGIGILHGLTAFRRCRVGRSVYTSNRYRRHARRRRGIGVGARGGAPYERRNGPGRSCVCACVCFACCMCTERPARYLRKGVRPSNMTDLVVHAERPGPAVSRCERQRTGQDGGDDNRRALVPVAAASRCERGRGRGRDARRIAEVAIGTGTRGCGFTL